MADDDELQDKLDEALTADVADASGDAPAADTGGDSAPPSTEAPWSALGYAAEKYGLDRSGFESDQQFIDSLVTATDRHYQRVQQLTPYEQQVQHYQQQLAERERQLAELRQPKEPAAPQKPAFDPLPEWKPEWNALIKQKEDGSYESSLPGMVEKYIAYQTARSERLNALLSDPANFLKPVVGGQQSLTPETVQQLVQEQVSALKEAWEVDRFIEAHASEFVDDNGNQTPFWQVFSQYHGELVKEGMEPRAARTRAMKLTRADYAEYQAQQQAQTPAPVSQQPEQPSKTDGFRQKANRTVSRGAPSRTPSAAVSEQSLEERLAAAFDSAN